MSTLNKKQLAFVAEYLVDLNATQAAIRAGYSKKTANEQAARLLANVSVGAAIQEAMQARSERTEITQDMVLRRWWEIATADPRKLIEYRRCACRFCHGKSHAWQWIDENEFIREYEAAVKRSEDDPDDEVHIPTNSGGYGFNPGRSPHPECPKCFGEGHGEVMAKDTRQLDSATAMLYAGVKVTKEGLEIKMQDQGKALENVARHLGMFTEKVEHSGKNGEPIQHEVAVTRGRLAQLREKKAATQEAGK